MRIGIEAWGLSGDMLNTGMGTYTARLLQGLARTSDVSVIAYVGPNEERPAWLDAGVGWQPVGRRLPAKFTALASRSLPLNRRLKADRIDVFHSASFHCRPQFPQVPSPPCPLVVTLHDLIIQTYYDPRTLPLRQQIFSGWNLRRAIKAEAVVAVSEYGRDQIVDYFNCPADRIHVIPNSIDFPPNSDPEVLRRWGVAAPYLLFAGSYEPRKNLTGALEAFASLVGDGLPHQLVAVVERESGHSPGIRPLIERLGLVDRVRLVDSLPESDLRALYTQAEALFFPSFAEGFGYPPLQAAACGLPAVVSDLPPLRETLGTWPVFVDPHRPLEMAAAIGELLGDAGARARMRAAGPDLAAKFSLVGNVGAHLDVYRSLTLGR